MTGGGAAGLIRRMLAVGATVLVAALGSWPTGSAVGAPHRASFPPARPTKVLILGDSVLAGAASRFGPALAGRDVTVDSVVDRTTAQGADVVALRGADWDVVVVMLGHNDGASPGVYQPAARRILDTLARVPRVIWLTIHEIRPYYVGVNQFLRAEATRRPNLRIADWNAVATANPSAMSSDGLHLNGFGAELMAGFVTQQVVSAEHDASLAFDQYTASAGRQRAAAQVLLLKTMAADQAHATLMRVAAADRARAEARAIAVARTRREAAARVAATRRAARAAAARRRASAARAAARRHTAMSTGSKSGPSSATLAVAGVLAAAGAVGLGWATRAVLARRRRRGHPALNG